LSGFWLPPEEAFQEAKLFSAFYDLASQATHCHYHHTLLSTRASLDSLWEEAAQEHEHWEVKNFGAMLEADCQKQFGDILKIPLRTLRNKL